MKILAPQIIPTREEIRERFNKRLGGISGIYSSMTALYSEETERLIMELWRKEDDQVYVRLGSFYCSNCQQQQIRNHHKFCPICGSKIIRLT